MNVWRHWGLQAALGLFLLVALCGCQNPFQSPPLVGIILWNQEIQSFEDNLQGVSEGLREEGYLDGLNVRLQIMNASGDRGRVAKAVEELREKGVKFLITMGTVPTLVALEVTSRTPLPFCLLRSRVPGRHRFGLAGSGRTPIYRHQHGGAGNGAIEDVMLGTTPVGTFRNFIFYGQLGCSGHRHRSRGRRSEDGSYRG